QIDLVDLVDGALRTPPSPTSFTAAQEKYLADHPEDGAYLFALINCAFDSDDGGRVRSLVGSANYLRSSLGLRLCVPSIEHALAAAPGDRSVRTGQVRMTADSLARFNDEIRDLLLRYATVARRDELQVRDQDLIDVWVVAGTARQKLSDVLQVTRQTR